MEQNGWLQHLLERMQSDIDEIKVDVKEINAAKMKLHGAVIVVSFIVTLTINAIALLLRI